MKVYATRDSVAAGDDVDAPHARVFSFPKSLTPLQVIGRIVADGYLAKIAGGKATWSAVSGRPLAVIAQQWTEPRRIPWSEPSFSDFEQQDGVYRIHFNYHVQRDPEIVFETLRELKLRAP